MNLPSFNLIDIILWLLLWIVRGFRKILREFSNDLPPIDDFDNPKPIHVKYMDEYEYLDYMEQTRMGRGGQSRKRWYI